MEYAVDASKNQTLGIRGWILIICTIEIFIAKYFTPFKIGIKGISEINFIIFIFLVMAGIRISLNREKISFQSFDYPLIILLVYSFFSILFSCYFYNYSYIEELILFKNYLNPFIIYFLFKNVIRTTKEAKTLIYILVIVLAIICFHALLSYFFSESEYIHYRGRAQGIIKEPNVLAMFILFHSPFLFSF